MLKSVLRYRKRPSGIPRRPIQRESMLVGFRILSYLDDRQANLLDKVRKVFPKGWNVEWGRLQAGPKGSLRIDILFDRDYVWAVSDTQRAPSFLLQAMSSTSCTVS